MTRQETDAIYDAGRETVVHVLLEMSRRIEQLTHVSTARKNGFNVLDALLRVFTGNPFVPTLDSS